MKSLPFEADQGGIDPIDAGAGHDPDSEAIIELIHGHGRMVLGFATNLKREAVNSDILFASVCDIGLN